MKIEIEIDDLVGYQFKSDENKVDGCCYRYIHGKIDALMVRRYHRSMCVCGSCY